MHPSRAIRGTLSQLLAGRQIILAVSGSIAAVEVVRVTRELIRHGADVRAVISPDAARIVSVEALRFATGHPVISELTGDVEHVSCLAGGEGRADLLLIAPATANTISKVAHGIDDTPVTSFASVALGGAVPILIAPAMHGMMGKNPALRENLERLKSWGVGIVASTAAEGEEKLASAEEIAAAVLQRLATGHWSGRRVLVIGGASREPIDSVRVITNQSSGRTAVALATQAFHRGAKVTFWAGPLEVPIPGYLTVDHWQSVQDLIDLLGKNEELMREVEAVFVPAALSDFTLLSKRGKISSRRNPSLTLRLRRAPKVLPVLRSELAPGTQLVGFKLGVDEPKGRLEREARQLLNTESLDWVVANDPETLGRRETTLLVLGRNGTRHFLTGTKMEVAGKLLDDIGRESANLVSTPRPKTPNRRRRDAPARFGRSARRRR